MRISPTYDVMIGFKRDEGLTVDPSGFVRV